MPSSQIVDEAIAGPLADVRAALARRIIGQEDMLESLLLALVSGGHVLLEGLPGLAKTTAVKTLASLVGLDFRRIQFTPDLLPSDLVGTEVFDAREGSFVLRRGPVFANLVLADEINRAPAKVQSALLEVMEERQVTLAGQTLPVPSPFLVLATQNPIEQEGTYPLPEAQVDRFLFKVRLDHPTPDEELRILRQQREHLPEPEPMTEGEALLAARTAVRDLYLDEALELYMVRIVDATRRPATYGLRGPAARIRLGASPRGTLGLGLASRARAWLQGRDHVRPEDVQAVALRVLRHRIRFDWENWAADEDPDAALEEILARVPLA